MWRYVPSWEKILVILAAVIVIQQVLKEVFGISMLGKKIYKGAPLIWKWMMRGYIFRAGINNKLDEIHQELKFNGGNSTKDMIKQLLNSDEIKTQILANLQSGMNLTALRLDINDITSDRMIFRMDSNGACTFINEAFLKQFGYTWRELQGFNWEAIIHEDDIEEVRERWDRAIKTKSRYANEQRIVCAGGEILKVMVVGYPIKENEVLKEFYGTIDLITN